VSSWHDYRVAFLVEKGLGCSEIVEHELSSKLERTLLSVKLTFKGRRVVVATSHLESNRKNAAYRGEQIAQIESVLLPQLHEQENARPLVQRLRHHF